MRSGCRATGRHKRSLPVITHRVVARWAMSETQNGPAVRKPLTSTAMAIRLTTNRLLGLSLLRGLYRDKTLQFALRPNCNVTHLECAEGKITNVHYRDPSGLQRTVSGKIVIVACSAIESVRLLKLSALQSPEFDKRINQNDLLGKYFLTHCFGGASAVMPGRYDKSVTVDSDWATDFCGDEKFLREKGLWAGGTIYNNTSDQALPIALARTQGASDLDTLWHGFNNEPSVVANQLLEFLNAQFNRRLSVSFMANQLPQKTNRIELHPNIRDKWGRNVAFIIKQWHAHDVYLMKTLADKCADILHWGGDPRMESSKSTVRVAFT